RRTLYVAVDRHHDRRRVDRIRIESFERFFLLPARSELHVDGGSLLLRRGLLRSGLLRRGLLLLRSLLRGLLRAERLELPPLLVEALLLALLRNLRRRLAIDRRRDVGKRVGYFLFRVLNLLLFVLLLFGAACRKRGEREDECCFSDL